MSQKQDNLDTKKNKKFEFSKWVMIVHTVLEIFVIGFTCVVIWNTKDTSPFMYLLPAVSVPSATAIGFYYNKAKIENKIKLMSSYGIKPNEDSFNDYN